MNMNTFPLPAPARQKASRLYRLGRKHLRQKGFGLFEVIIVLGIVALFAVVVLSRKDMADTSNESTNLVSDITAIQASLSQIQLASGDFGTVSLNKTLIVGKKLPSSFRVSGDTIKTQRGSEVIVSGQGDVYTIELTNVDKAVCLSVVPALSSGWQSVQINGGSTLTSFPISAVDATNYCSADDRVSIKWTSY